MKTGYVVALGMALMTGNGMAADTTGNADTYFSARAVERIVTVKVVRNYQFCLRSENNGVVESALGQVAFMKLVNPDQPMEMLQEDITQLVLFGRTPRIRYRAYLAAQVIDNPGMFAGIAMPACTTCDELFDELAGELQRAVSADGSKKLVLSK